MPLISVIVPVFNGETFIRATIESVLNQTFSDLEVIVIDDGSQDSTVEIVSSFQDARLKQYSYENSGASVSRNRGIAHAIGEFVSFLDADDLWTPDKLEAQFLALKEHPEAAVAYSWVDYIDQSGKFLWAGNHLTINGDIHEALLIHNVLENGSNPLIRRQALAEVGDFNPQLSNAEDWDMLLRLAARYQFVAVPFPHVLYRVSTHSKSSNIAGMEAASLQVIEEAFAQAPECLQHLKKRSFSMLYRYLTSKALQVPFTQQNGRMAAQFFRQAIKHDWTMLWQWKTSLKLMCKIAIVSALPPKQSQLMITISKQMLAR